MEKTIEEVTQHTAFQGLSEEGKRVLLSKHFPNFRQLKLNEQTTFIKDKSLLKPESEEEISTPGEPIFSLEEFKKEIKKPENIGGMIGGLAGSPLGLPGDVIGSGLGGAIGKATETSDLKEIGKAGLKQGLYSIGGRAVTGIAGKVLSPFAKTITPESKIAVETLGKYMPKEERATRVFSRLMGKKVPVLLPAEATENKTLDILQNIAESSITGGKGIADFKNIRGKAIGNMIDDIVDQFGAKAEPDLIGETFAKVVKGNLKAKRLITDPIYNSAIEMGKNSIIPTASLKEYIKPLLEISKELGGIEAKNAGDDLIELVSKLKDGISFPAAKDLRTRFMSKVDEFSITNKKAPAIGRAKQLIKLLDQSIDDTLKVENPEALAIWREANRLYDLDSKQFNNAFLRRLIKLADPDFGGEPEMVMKGIFKRGAISNINRAWKAVDPAIQQQMKSWYIQDLLVRSANPEGEILGKTWVNNLYGKAGMGQKALNAIFSSEELKGITDAATTLKLIQTKQGEGTGNVLVKLMQGGAVVGIMQPGKARKIASATLIIPAVLSRMFTNPITAKWLTQGFKLPAGTSAAASLGAKLIGAAANIKNNMEREQESKISAQPETPIKASQTVFKQRPIKPSLESIFGTGEK